MARHLVLVAGFVGLTALSVSAQNATLVQAGKELYSSKECTRCHMVSGSKGNKNGKLDGVASRMSSAEIRQWLTAPAQMEARLDHKSKVKVRMSSRKRMTLTDADVNALVAYLMTLK